MTSLKHVEVDEKTGKSYVHYIPIGPKSLKIEPIVKTKKFNEDHTRGWRIFINLNTEVSEDETDIYCLPIQKRSGKVAEFYELFLDNRYFQRVSTGNPQQPGITHPISEKIMEYCEEFYENRDRIKTIDEIREERRAGYDEDDLSIKGEDDFTILSIDRRLSDTLVIPSSEGMPYVNPVESDLLSLDDISNIELRIPKFSEDQKIKVERLLDEMFLNEDFLNGSESTGSMLSTYSCIRGYLEGETPSFSGMVLYGPPGTGKTHLIQKSLIKIYRELGFNIHIQEIGDVLSNQYVGGLASNVTEKIFGPAIAKVRTDKVPCFVYIDEATDLLRKDGSGGNDGGWRAQGIEAMKSFINRSRYPGLVVCFATNLDRQNFDRALTRSGRLKAIQIGLPNYERCFEVWTYVNKKYLFPKAEDVGFTNDQLIELANICKDKINIATIAETCENYRSENRDWTGDYGSFRVKFGEAAKRDVNVEFDDRIGDLEKMSKSGIRTMDSIKSQIAEINKEREKYLHDIEVALDPSKPSTISGVLRTFSKYFSSKNRVDKAYGKCRNSLLEWLKAISDSKGANLLDETSFLLMKRSVVYIRYLDQYLDKVTVIPLWDNLTFILKVFTSLINLKNDPKAHLEETIDIDSIRRIEQIISNLPESLKEFDEKDVPPPSSPVFIPGGSGLVLPGDPRFTPPREGS